MKTITATVALLLAVAGVQGAGFLFGLTGLSGGTNGPASQFFLVQSNTSLSGIDNQTLGNNESHMAIFTKYTATVTTNVAMFQLLMGKLVGNPNATVTGYFYGDSAGVLNSNALFATSSTTNSSLLADVGTSNITSFVFASPPVQTNGSVYWIGVTLSSVTGFGNYLGVWMPDGFVNQGSLVGTNVIGGYDWVSRQAYHLIYAAPTP